jgi:Flp pilus assembly protein TadD
LAGLQNLAESYPPGEEPQRVLYLMGLAYTAMGRHADAVEVLAMARDRGPPSGELLCRLGEAELESGQRVTARRTAQQALAVEPNHAAARALLSRIDVARDTAGITR